MAVDFTKANAEIARQTTIVASLQALLTTLTTEISTISGNTSDATTQASLDALVNGMTANDDATAAAIVANTPAAAIPPVVAS